MNDNGPKGFDPFDEITVAYATDPEFRREVAGNPREAFASKGLDLPPEVEILVCEDTPDTKHIVVPPDPNVPLSDEMLGVVAGGTRVSSASSLGCSSTFSTIPSTVGSAGTGSSAATLRP